MCGLNNTPHTTQAGLGFRSTYANIAARNRSSCPGEEDKSKTRRVTQSRETS